MHKSKHRKIQPITNREDIYECNYYIGTLWAALLEHRKHQTTNKQKKDMENEITSTKHKMMMRREATEVSQTESNNRNSCRQTYTYIAHHGSLFHPLLEW